MNKLLLLLAFSHLLIVSCTEKKEGVEEPQKEVDYYFVNQLNPYTIGFDSLWEPIPSSNFINPSLDETSGIVPSVLNDSCYWLNEDSGSPGRIFLYSQFGIRLAVYNFRSHGVKDMEDLAYAIDLTSKDTLIYIGDIGDNNNIRSDIKILVIHDKKMNNNEDSDVDTVYTIRLKYESEEGISPKHNCEALICDPYTSCIYLFTKESSRSYIYKLTPPFDFENVNILHKIGEFRINGQKVTAADISLDGERFVLKTYEYIFLWKRKINVTFEEMLKNIPQQLPYQGEAQGEAFCFSVNASKYLTISELNNGIKPQLRVYSKK